MIIMRLLINKKDLALLLEQKRDYIVIELQLIQLLPEYHFYYQRLQRVIMIYFLLQASH